MEIQIHLPSTCFEQGIRGGEKRHVHACLGQADCDSKHSGANMRRRYTIPKNYHGITVGTVAR